MMWKSFWPRPKDAVELNGAIEKAEKEISFKSSLADLERQEKLAAVNLLEKQLDARHDLLDLKDKLFQEEKEAIRSSIERRVDSKISHLVDDALDKQATKWKEYEYSYEREITSLKEKVASLTSAVASKDALISELKNLLTENRDMLKFTLTKLPEVKTVEVNQSNNVTQDVPA